MALGDRYAVRDVRRDVVAGRLEAEAVALLQRVDDEAGRLPAADAGGELVALWVMARSGRVGIFVIVAVALVNLHQRLDFHVVVAPVGAHAGSAGVAGAD